jgi:FixJ family two-component response regulator
MSTNDTETVFVVDDDESICDAICNLLDSVGLAVKHYGSCEEFLEQWRNDAAACLVLDVRLPGMTGVEFQERLAELDNRIPIIFITAHGDVPMVRKVMKAGAIEFLTKPFKPEELLAAVAQAFAIERARRQKESSRRSIQARFDSLKEREREIMTLVTDGLLNKQIAAKLNLSEISVKVYRRRMMEKMRAMSVAELTKIAAELKDADGGSY